MILNIMCKNTRELLNVQCSYLQGKVDSFFICVRCRPDTLSNKKFLLMIILYNYYYCEYELINFKIQTLALDNETFSWLLLFIMKKRASIKYSSIFGFSFCTLSTLLLTGVPLPKIKNHKIK